MRHVFEVGLEKAFEVLGRPAPQGSMKTVISRNTGNQINKPSSKNLKPWRNEIGQMARWARVPLHDRDVAIKLELTFVFLKPKSARRVNMTTTPDIDKLLRACMDALTSIAYYDDAQVVSVVMDKEYGIPERLVIAVGPATLADND